MMLVYILIGCVLFRFFRHRKAIGHPEGRVAATWRIGVMADDVLAGVYAQLILRAIVMAKLF
jgi:phosphatidylglycerophosphatase A